MHHGHGRAVHWHALWTAYIGMQSEQGHAAWTWTYSINMDMDKDKIWTYCRLLLDWHIQQTTLFSEDFAEELAEVSKS
jgi:hypothetical protein